MKLQDIPEWLSISDAVQRRLIGCSAMTIRRRLKSDARLRCRQRGVGKTAEVFMHRSAIKSLRELYPPELSATPR